MTMKKNWSTDDIPDMSGKVAIVTGANCGIGFETARALAIKGATVVMACRSQEKGEAAAEKIRSQEPAGEVVPMLLDLADLESVRQFADEIHASFDHLDLLINNAGLMMIPQRQETAQGFEMQFGVNHLGHFALTALLQDLLVKTPGARVVNVSSAGHRIGRINFDDLNAEHSYNPAGAYGQSKLANLLFTYELQRYFQKMNADAISVAAHPGWTATNLQRHTPVFQFLNPLLSQSPDMGALPTLYGAVAGDVGGGDFFGPGGWFEMRGYPKQVKSSDRSHDKECAKCLWAASEKLTDIKFSNQ